VSPGTWVGGGRCVTSLIEVTRGYTRLARSGKSVAGYPAPVSKPKRFPGVRTAEVRSASDELRSSCPIAGALDLLGDRWTLLVLRDVLLFDRHLFGELQASPERISTNTLTERLRRLELSGLIERRIYQSNPERCSYHATDKARELVPVLRELVRWSARHVPGVVRPTAAHLRLFAAAARRRT